ncbi:MAG TPA: hypothetical protein VK903_08020 [Propionicimonas sp.]|nr:hypothetical protein [Propionicimonas sp.]
MGSPWTQNLGRWTLACALAETVGMTAASGAAKAVLALSDEPGALGGAPVALALVVAGGLVEGTALGVAQGFVLSTIWPALGIRRYVAVTVVVAGLGWAAGSAPGVLAADDGGADPPLTVMLAGAAGIGLLMGPLLGAAQAWAIGPAVRHPWRWVVANTVAWPPAMMAIFLGASRPEKDWSVLTVLALGAVTGVVAGALLGVLSGLWLPSLDGPSLRNRVVLALVESRRFGMDRALVGLEVRGRRSGRVFRFPAQYAAGPAGLVVVPGHAERKTWWRNLRGLPVPVDVLLDGRWETATAHLLLPGDPGLPAAIATYRERWPKVSLPPDQPAVVLEVAGRPARNADEAVGVDQ